MKEGRKEGRKEGILKQHLPITPLVLATTNVCPKITQNRLITRIPLSEVIVDAVISVLKTFRMFRSREKLRKKSITMPGRHCNEKKVNYISLYYIIVFIITKTVSI